MERKTLLKRLMSGAASRRKFPTQLKLCDKSGSKNKNAKYDKGAAGTAGKDWISVSRISTA